MKHQHKAPLALLGAAGLGLFAFVIRRVMYAAPVDATGLLAADHPLKMAQLLINGAAVLLAVAGCKLLDGSDAYEDTLAPGMASFAGHTAAAAGILITVLTNPPMLPGYLGQAWRVLGFVSPVCLFLAGYGRLQGKRPHFLLHMGACLFFAAHLVNHYQLWCSDPQFQDYGFTLFGTIALTLFAFQWTAYDVDLGKRRTLVFWGLLAVYLGIGELARSGNPYLYLGGTAWVAQWLYQLPSAPKKPQEEV